MSFWNRLKLFFTAKAAETQKPADKGAWEGVRVLRHGTAQRVVFYYPGEEGAYVDQALVTLFENGIVHIRARSEETTTHLSHCEVLWKFEATDGENATHLRVLKFPDADQSPKNPQPTS
ncbi:MAG: hypothetical protein EOP09_02040 [Proteobacteria bacterium]|nr:MAG: hypothetical protein EOP09_02040 [Pseudomonadota bacterium]